MVYILYEYIPFIDNTINILDKKEKPFSKSM